MRNTCAFPSFDTSVDPQQFLNGLQKSPNSAAKKRIGDRIQARIGSESPLLEGMRREICPPTQLKNTVWGRISPKIALPQADAFTRIKIAFQPSLEFKERVRLKVLQSLEPISQVANASRGPVFFKWASAFVVVALLAKLSPLLFIASPTMADSQSLLLPTRGEVSVSIAGLWQTMDGEMVLEPGMMIRTHDGEVTLLFNDDGAIRLAPETTVTVHDTADRLEPASEVLPSLTLHTGEVWAQGLIPKPLRPLAIKTRNGIVAVNGGSVSIAVKDHVDVKVFDRSAVVHYKGEPRFLTSGERTRLSGDSVLLVKKIPAKWYQYKWPRQNLARDAVHRHEIAQRQHELRIANAGVLPTSPMYPVKRFAELMDVWLTWGEEARVAKQLNRAETRLNEAAALIYEGQEPGIALDEYRETLDSLSEGESNGSLAEFLVQRALAESAAQMAAALPGDEAYVIKKTVLETSADLSYSASEEDAQGALLLDGLAVMLQNTDQGRTDIISGMWSELQPYLRTLEDTELALDPSMHKEAKTLLAFLASSLHVASKRGADIDPELLDDIAAYLPAPKQTAVVALSEEQVMEIVQRIREKIFLYDMTRSRINQYIAEMKALQGHPDQGRILRRLALTLPNGPENFPQRVYKEIVKLRWQRAGETI